MLDIAINATTARQLIELTADREIGSSRSADGGLVIVEMAGNAAGSGLTAAPTLEEALTGALAKINTP